MLLRRLPPWLFAGSRWTPWGLSALLFLLGGEARAAGEESDPIPSAKQLALGGTSLGTSADAAAVFRNPAGLVGLTNAEILGGVQLSWTQLRGVPRAEPRSAEELVVLPHLAFAIPLERWLSLGLGVQPLGRRGVSYAGPGVEIDARHTLLYEASPALAIQVPEELVPGKLTVGLGYRLTLASYSRQRTVGESLSLDALGLDGTGVRAGLQWSPIPEVRLGAAFRSPVGVGASAGSAELGERELEDVSVSVRVPLQAGFGARFDLDRFGLAVDYELTNHSGNDSAWRTKAGETLSPRLFSGVWGHAVRSGFEYRIPGRRVEFPIRLGYVWESEKSRRSTPDAFALPATSLHSFSLGLGYQTRGFRLASALVYRHGSTQITAAEMSSDCRDCSGAGAYSVHTLGTSVDAALSFD